MNEKIDTFSFATYEGASTFSYMLKQFCFIKEYISVTDAINMTTDINYDGGSNIINLIKSNYSKGLCWTREDLVISSIGKVGQGVRYRYVLRIPSPSHSVMDFKTDYTRASMEARIKLVGEISGETKITDVIFNEPATIVKWSDGTKTVVKTQGDDEFDPEKGLAMAYFKKFNGNKGKYYDEMKKWIGVYKEPELPFDYYPRFEPFFQCSMKPKPKETEAKKESHIIEPLSVDPSRVKLVYSAKKAGTIFIRNGAQDLYFNDVFVPVRIRVGDNYYIKGLAVHGKESMMPKGYDIVYYTDKPVGTDFFNCLCRLSKDNKLPFGVPVKQYLEAEIDMEKDTVTFKPVSAVNIVMQEGDN